VTFPLYVKIDEIYNLACPAAESVSARTSRQFLCDVIVMVVLFTWGDAVRTDWGFKPNVPARAGCCDGMWCSSNTLALGRTSSFILNSQP